MTRLLLNGRALAGFGFACAVALTSPILLQTVAAPVFAADAVRPEMGKPLQAAQQSAKDKKYAEALAHLREADAVPGKTANEEALIEQIRLAVATYADEPAVAAKAFESLAASNNLAPAQRLQYIPAIAGSYFRNKEYGAAATWYNRYFVAGGTDLAVRQAYVQTFYYNNDFANMAKAANETVTAYEGAGQQPPELLFQLLLTAGIKLNDKKMQQSSLERAVALYPKQEYWAQLVRIVANRQGFPDRLGLDVNRFKFAIGGLTTASDYMEFAELAIQAGLYAEAKAIVDKAYATGVMGTGAEAERHGRLRDMAKRQVDADQPTLANSEAEAAKADNGNALVNIGMNLYGYGQFEKAAVQIQAGIAKGNLKYPDDAKLHLGIVYMAAGNKAKAIETFKSIKSADAVADLARLWLIKVSGRAA